MAAVDDLDARVTALEAKQVDHRSILAAINALGANQRDHGLAIGDLKAGVSELKAELGAVKAELGAVKAEMRGFHRSAEESLAEMKSLILGLHER